MDAGERWMRHMKRGEMEEAWRVSDGILEQHTREPGWRGRAHALPRHLQPVWDGTPVAGQHVLVRCYHGLGDTIQFIRYAPMLHATAASVSVWAQPELIPLLHSARGIDRIIPLHDGTPEVPFDVDLEVMELPHLFRSSLRTIPRDVPYLHPTRVHPTWMHPARGDMAHDDAGNARVPAARPLQVGLAWQAGGWDDRRSVPPRLLAPLADVPEVAFHLLQHGATAVPPIPAAHRPADGSVLDTALRMLRLDLMITVDSMPAHLAGALGVPTWALLHSDPDWRWLECGRYSPWYPTMRLFRQRAAGDWAPVVERLAAALACHARHPGSRMAPCRGRRVSVHSSTRGTSHA